MPSYWDWTPRDSRETSQTHNDPKWSFALEHLTWLLEHLSHNSSIEVIKGFLESLKAIPPRISATPSQEFNYLFWVGKSHIYCKDWDAANRAFEQCSYLAKNVSNFAHAHLLQAWIYATQELHDYEASDGLYNELISLTTQLIQEKRADFIEEDPYSFLCNLYRGQAMTRLFLCSPSTARALLENHAIILLDKAKEPSLNGYRQKNQHIWRELHLLVPWALAYIIMWEVKMSDNPTELGADLIKARIAIVETTLKSQIFSEGKGWTAEIHICAAEITLTRCSVPKSQAAQRMLLSLTITQLMQAYRFRPNTTDTQFKKMFRMMFNVPMYEVKFRREFLTGDIKKIQSIKRKIISIIKEIEIDNKPDYQVIKARYLLILAKIEFENEKPFLLSHAIIPRKSYFYIQEVFEITKRQSGLHSLIEKEAIGILNQIHQYGNEK